ncbi:scp-like extracellular protein, putative, partial [Ichthyophthirius multifiliis]
MSTQQELLKEKPQLAQQIDTLYHVDIRMDNLKSFLSNIGNVINQQSIVINQMQIDLKTKAQTEKVELAFKQISKAIELNDTELHKKVAVLLDKPKSESTGDLIIDSSNMVYLEDQLSLKFCSNDKYETYKKSVLDKISELENKLVIIDRKGNANEVNESLIKALKDLDEKLYALYREDGKLKNEIQDLLVKIELQGKALEKGEQQEQNNNISDPHRICALESDSKQLMYDISEFKRIVSNLDSEIRRKFDALEHKVLSQFNNIKKKDQANFSREEIIGMIERGKIFAEEKLKVIESDLVDMKGKIGLISDLDKKLKRKFRELQDNTDWSKKLEEKANNDETKKEFLHIDEKIKNINALVSQFRKEFETIEEFYLQLASLLKNNQQETVALITGNTRIIPNRCVACGTKGRQNFNTSDVRGTDGKIYKADFGSQNQTSVYEQQEVFDVLPSEIGLPNIYVNEEKQNKFVQFKGRPDSAK